MAKAKVKAPEAPAVNMQLLAALVAANTSPAGYMLVSKADSQPLVDAGFAEVNTAIADGETFATRATEKGIAQVPKTEQTAPAGAPATAASPKFAIVSGVPIPETARKGVQRTETYPFTQLEVGQSFFIPATDKKPNPERSYASTVASARNRFSTPHATETKANRKGVQVPVKVYSRDYTIKAVADGAAYGAPGVKGAAVWRTK